MVSRAHFIDGDRDGAQMGLPTVTWLVDGRARMHTGTPRVRPLDPTGWFPQGLSPVPTRRWPYFLCPVLSFQDSECSFCTMLLSFGHFCHV